jgi:tellurite resistance protein TerC
LETVGTPTLWIAFLGFVLAMMVIDLGVLHREAKPVTPSAAIRWTLVWVALAAVFAVIVYFKFGSARALEFVTGYLVEKALSVDNLFVFLLMFSYFKVPAEHQRRVLFWGILGALLMRAAFILAGTALLARFSWMIYVFGGFLVITGGKLLFAGDSEVDPGENKVVRLIRRFVPLTEGYHGARFSVVQGGKRFATPLLLVLVVIEVTDVVFALDSLPAIFAITLDPFIVFTSNIFAIMGLRALYFLLQNMMGKFRYLNVGLAIVLVFVGAKMLVGKYFHVPIGVSLGVIVGTLTAAVLASALLPVKPEPDESSPS